MDGAMKEKDWFIFPQQKKTFKAFPRRTLSCLKFITKYPTLISINFRFNLKIWQHKYLIFNFNISVFHLLKVFLEFVFLFERKNRKLYIHFPSFYLPLFWIFPVFIYSKLNNAERNRIRDGWSWEQRFKFHLPSPRKSQHSSEKTRFSSAFPPDKYRKLK